ncbi:MAG: D-glycero-beta-D-manno-heptose-7-phosphate kinase [Bacteroidia bacterium]
MSIISKIESFAKLNILVIGDVMVDAYYFGSVDRISPEAPVSVISVSKKDHRPGGAANVALNLKSLGAKTSLCAVVGKDEEGRELISLLKKENIGVGGILIDTKRPTTIKTRVISGSTHLLRIDHESTDFVGVKIENQIIAFIEVIIKNVDAIIFEDYNKGLLTERIISTVIGLANKNNVPTIVDPKKVNFFTYKNCTLFKPNRKEIKEGLKTEMDLTKTENLEMASQKLMDIINCKNVMVTLSEDGVFLKSKNKSSHIKAHQRSITDVSGAGDTVVSIAALCLASGVELELMAEIANIAGGLVCQKVGVVPIEPGELLDEIERLKI